MIMMRTENDSNSSPPTTRIYVQDKDSIRVPPIPVLGMTYAAGKQLKNYLDLSNTVSGYRYFSFSWSGGSNLN